MTRDELRIGMHVRYHKAPAEVYLVLGFVPHRTGRRTVEYVRIGNVHGHELSVPPSQLFPYVEAKYEKE